MSYCERCDRWFGSYEAKQQHIKNSSAHFWCDQCDREFVNYNGLQCHLKTSRSHATHTCSICDDYFFSQTEYTSHLREEHNWCSECGKCFSNWNALRNHEQSDVHKQRSITCPLCRQLTFKTLSAVAAHVESSRCNGFKGSRQDLLNLIRRWEAQSGAPNTFTRPAIEYPGHSDRSMAGRCTIQLAQQCYNKYYDEYQCPLCDKCVDAPTQLVAHLNSRIHADCDYRCHACSSTFVSLTGLVQHLERTQCRTKKTDDIARLTGAIRTLRF
ncbi:hypothetical protein MIR68_008821 [Amoeboaphelidium protococcarum]|nr:hypothetical protein MIR68_008821 [Amoeboaphelidium protococcarum]